MFFIYFIGHHQVERQARLCPPPYRRRDRRGQRHRHCFLKRPPGRCRPCPEARVAGHVGYVCKVAGIMENAWATNMTTRCLHTFGLRAHRRGRRLRRLVLPLPRFSLRHLWPYKERTCSFEPRDSGLRFPRGGQARHWLNGMEGL